MAFRASGSTPLKAKKTSDAIPEGKPHTEGSFSVEDLVGQPVGSGDRVVRGEEPSVLAEVIAPSVAPAIAPSIARYQSGTQIAVRRPAGSIIRGAPWVGIGTMEIDTTCDLDILVMTLLPGERLLPPSRLPRT